MEIIAHRGASSLAPENTLRAIEEAIKLNVACIEIDCQLSRDKQVVIFHGTTLDRIPHAGPVKIGEVSYDELRKHDVGNGQYMPLLEEVLELVNGKCILMLESKTEGTAQQIMRVLSEFPWLNRIAITSSFIPELISARQYIPDIPISLVIKDYGINPVEINTYYAIREFSIDRELVTEEWVKNNKQKGFVLRVFTVNDVPESRKYESWGVDAIFSDYPQLFIPTEALSYEVKDKI